MDRLYPGAELANYFWPPLAPRWVAEVDWNNDGYFDGVYDSLEADTDGIQYKSGKDKASQLVTTAVAGSARVTVKNEDGLYSRFNSSSPLYGLMLPRRKMKISSLIPSYAVLWTGWTTAAPQATAAQGNIPRAQVNGIGALGLLANPNLKINPAPLHNVRTGVVINAILDAAGWPAANRIIDVGEMYVGDWFPQDIGALEALQQVVDIEGGSLEEGRNWDIVFKGRYNRFTAARSISSQATFSDAAGSANGYSEIQLTEEQVYNLAEVTVTQYRQDIADSTLWHLDPISLQPGETRVIIAQYAAGVAFADTGLTHTVAVVPSSLSGSIVESHVIKSRQVEYTIRNTHGSLAAQVEITLTGKAYRQVTQLVVRREDTVSQGIYQLSKYPFPSPWFHSEPYAAAQAEWVIDKYSDPRPQLRVSFPPADQATLDVMTPLAPGDRLTVVATSPMTQFGLNGDFYVEATALQLASEQLPMFTMDLSEADADPGWALWEVAKWDTVGKWAR